jgi:hypothetical protein
VIALPDPVEAVISDLDSCCSTLSPSSESFHHCDLKLADFVTRKSCQRWGSGTGIREARLIVSRATTTASAVNPCALVHSLVMNMSAVATPNHDLWRVRNNVTYNSRVRPFNSRLNRREGLTTGRTLEKGVVVGRLRHFAHAIAIIAAAIASAAAIDLPEISLWDEGGIAFGNLTFWNRPLLGTATAIVVDCQFLDRDGQKVDQRKLTVEEPVYGRTIQIGASLAGMLRLLGLEQSTQNVWLGRELIEIERASAMEFCL